MPKADPNIAADQPIEAAPVTDATQQAPQVDRPAGPQHPPGVTDVQNTPPQFNDWTRDIPFDSAVFLDKPVAPVIDANDKAKMDALRKREQALAGQGVQLLTPQFPELFPDAPKVTEAKPPDRSQVQPDESEMGGASAPAEAATTTDQTGGQ